MRLPSRRIVRLGAEAALLYLGLPLALALRILPNAPIPALLGASAVLFALLWRDPTFDRRQLAGPGPARRLLLPVLVRAAAIAAAVAACVAWFAPESLFSLPRRAPVLWAAVMLLYPLLSVYPQELAFRAFLFHRYAPLFPSRKSMIASSGVLFGFAHLCFGNLLAVALTVPAGVLFAATYARSRSLLLVSLEHALLGNFIFTIGLGQYFYHGVAR